MPAPPKIPDGRRQIRRVEVFDQVKAQHPGHSACHIGIPGEIHIDLPRKEKHGHDEADSFVLGEPGKGMVHDDRDVVGNYHFFK